MFVLPPTKIKHMKSECPRSGRRREWGAVAPWPFSPEHAAIWADN